MTITLVSGGAGDLPAVMEVMAAAFSDRFGEAWTRSQCAGILPMSGVSLALARDDADRILGFALYRTILDDSELLLLAVLPTVQRQGVGRKLLDHFLEDAKKNGANRIHLEVRDGNPAIRMYEAAGFTQSNRRRDYYRGADGMRYDALSFTLTSGI